MLFKKWFLKHRPDVVVCWNENALSWIKHAGLSVPKDIAVVHMDAAAQARRNYWTGIDQQHYLLGATGIETLVSLIQFNQIGLPSHPKSIRIKGTWIEGKTA